MKNQSASLSINQQLIDNQGQRKYTAKEVGEIFCYMLQSLGYPSPTVNLDNGIAQAIQQPLATQNRMTMTVDDVAQELGVSEQTVYAMIHRRELHALKAGRRYVISRSAFMSWMDDHMQEGEYREAC